MMAGIGNSLVDIAVGAVGMWVVQTFVWPYAKTWLKNSLREAVKD